MPSPHLSLVDRHVEITPFPGDGTADIQGRVLTSGAKLASGFISMKKANLLLQGVDLEAHLAGETELSTLCLILRGCEQYSGIHTIDKNLILITSAFIKIYHGDVFLIYDVTDSSLRMIPSKPFTYPPMCTNQVLVARRHKDGVYDDSDSSYALVYPGTTFSKDQVLYLAFSTFGEPWKATKHAKFPGHANPDKGQFYAKEVFSFRGRGYLADVLLGVLYCDYNDVLSDDVDCVDVRSLDLPVGCKISGNKDELPNGRTFRAMGPVGDSIKFVSIDGFLELDHPEHLMVRVWRLMEDMNWALEYEFKYASVMQQEFVLGLVPMFPFLSVEEDSVIYFALGRLPWNLDRMVRFDLIRETYHCTPLSSSQSTCLGNHIAVSHNVMDKLLTGSSQPSHVEI